MTKPYKYAVLLLLVINVVFIALFAGGSFTPTDRSGGHNRISGQPLFRSVKWTVYVGLNDKDEARPLFSSEEAKSKLNAVAAKHVRGFTVREAEGFWLSDTGQQFSEKTLIYDFLETTEQQLAAVIEEMKTSMNQESVLVERNETLSIFY
jgi:Protein of unknown function (DUF3574).